MYFVCTWQEYTKFTNDCQDCTRQVNTCIFMSSYLPVWAISRENIKSKSSLSRNAVLSSFYTANIFCYFRLVCWRRRQKKKILPQKERHPPCLSSVSQCGSTADDTAVSLDQRPHQHCGRARLVRVLPSLSADWLTRLSITRLPGNQDHLLLRLSVTPSSLWTLIF